MNIALDSFDHDILGALIDDSTRTNAELSELVGLSPSQCSRRRAKLEADGVIKGYSARVNEAALGYGIRAITRVSLSAHGEGIAEGFTRFLSLHDEIERAYSITGDADYVLMIRAKNLEHFATFVHTHLLPQKHTMQVRSDIVLLTVKS